MIRNKQYPYVHIPTIKTQNGSKIPSHEFIHRMSTPQTTGWFYEQKVIKPKQKISFFSFLYRFILIATSYSLAISIPWPSRSSCKIIKIIFFFHFFLVFITF